MSKRHEVLSENLRAVRSRIADAATHVGRDPSDITLIVVTKTWPASDVVMLAELGVTDIGENRDQEAAQKHREVQALLGAGEGRSEPLTWHFIGQLQTNKAKSVAGYADVVQSVDRLRLVNALDRAVGEQGRSLRCLVQVQLDQQEQLVQDGPGGAQRAGRGGADARQALELADAIESASHLRLSGVMGVAPLGQDPLPAFARLREVALQVRAAHSPAKIISAGMSGDLEAAVTHGATHVRVGSAVLGGRPPFG